jgi:hypothetical protein
MADQANLVVSRKKNTLNQDLQEPTITCFWADDAQDDFEGFKKPYTNSTTYFITENNHSR